VSPRKIIFSRTGAVKKRKSWTLADMGRQARVVIGFDPAVPGQDMTAVVIHVHGEQWIKLSGNTREALLATAQHIVEMAAKYKPMRLCRCRDARKKT
jgi:hypothetical protein